MKLDKALALKGYLRRNLVYDEGGDNVIFQSKMVLQPPLDDVGIRKWGALLSEPCVGAAPVSNLGGRVYLVVDAQEFYDAPTPLYIPQTFVREWDVNTKNAVFRISRTEFEGSWPYYLEHDGTLTEWHDEKVDRINFPISFTFQEYIGRMTGKTVTKGRPRTRKKFYLQIGKR